MSDEECMDGNESDTQILTAEYKDGQLQIFNMPSLHAGEGSSQSGSRYMQVMDPGKGVVQLNLTLVRCEGEEGDSSYRLVTNGECEQDSDSSPVTCVLQDHDDGVSYVMVDAVDGEQDLVELEPSSDDAGPYGLSSYEQEQHEPVSSEPPSDPVSEVASEPELTSEPEAVPDNVKKGVTFKPKIPQLSPQELLRRAEIVRQLKLRTQPHPQPQPQWPAPRRGRRRRNLPPPHELLASPSFRLFLYSCKKCPYKCNAMKDLTEHRLQEHRGVKSRDSGFQCAKCPYRAPLPHLLTKHMEDKHWDSSRLSIGKMITLDSKEVEEADVLVCGACGFECAERDAFRDHITQHHM